MATQKNIKYWKERKIDWKEHYQSTHNHPHRYLISSILKTVNFQSLWEVGCGAGANLIRIIQDIPGKQLGGSDVSEDAIKACREAMKGGMFNVESGENMMMSDKSVDIVLTDMCLIYVDHKDIDKYIKEIKRIGRKAVVLCEFHSDSWWDNFKSRFGRYKIYNYKKLLEKHGFYGIMAQKIEKEYWGGTDNNTKFRYLITAKI